jgi:3-hydroxybutyryl-CoA dehydratase
MLLGKKRKLGRKIEEISVGEKLEITKKITDQDLLLYLGLTNDNNPLFIQHDYASLTPFKKPIVPQIMITGIITSSISKYLPGPGSSITKQQLNFPKPLYHYATIEVVFEVIKVEKDANCISISFVGKDEVQDVVVEGEVEVCPPYPQKSITAVALDNF